MISRFIKNKFLDVNTRDVIKSYKSFSLVWASNLSREHTRYVLYLADAACGCSQSNHDNKLQLAGSNPTMGGNVLIEYD